MSKAENLERNKTEPELYVTSFKKCITISGEKPVPGKKLSIIKLLPFSANLISLVIIEDKVIQLFCCSKIELMCVLPHPGGP